MQRHVISVGDAFFIKEDIAKKLSDEQKNRLWPCLFLEKNKLIINNELISMLIVLKIINNKHDIKKFVVLATLKKNGSLIANAFTTPTVEHFDKVCM